ncbi:MAG: hypothetical protein AAGD10_15960 [Myxococcota bacterium]
MASNTRKTETKRLGKSRAQGKERKRKMERDGTTRTEAEIFGNVLPR